MKPLKQVESLIEKVLFEMLKWSKKVGNVAVSEVPQYVKELLRYEGLSQGVLGVLSLIPAILILIFNTILLKQFIFIPFPNADSYVDANAGYLVWIIVSTIAIVFYTVEASIPRLLLAIKVIVSPRVAALDILRQKLTNGNDR